MVPHPKPASKEAADSLWVTVSPSQEAPRPEVWSWCWGGGGENVSPLQVTAMPAVSLCLPFSAHRKVSITSCRS